MSEKYYHGVRVMREGTDSDVSVSSSVIQVIVGTAPVNLAENPTAVVNVPVVCTSLDDAKKKIGYCDDFESYTLCQSIYTNFVEYAVKPVVFINVLDPQKHKKDNAAKGYGVINSQVVVDDLTGILRDSVKVKAGEDVLQKGTDYILSFDKNGCLVITMLSEQAEALESVMVESSSLDPSKVTVEDIIGGYDVKTGKESGLEVIRQVYPRTGMVPALLLAPGWSHIQEVGAVMLIKSQYINGVFGVESLLDLPTTETRLYTDVPQAKEDIGYQDGQGIALWPMGEGGGHRIYYSAEFGALVAYTDASNGNIPSLYPSNKSLKIDKAVLSDGTEVCMDWEQANTLNGVGVVTMVNAGGLKSWGNNTSIYPNVTDVEERWIACKRMFLWISNGLITQYNEKVDDPANYRLIEDICDSENIRLNSYKADGKMPGGRIEYNEEENRVEKVLTGKVVFRIYLAAFTPAEDVLFILKFDPEILKDSLSATGGVA